MTHFVGVIFAHSRLHLHQISISAEQEMLLLWPLIPLYLLSLCFEISALDSLLLPLMHTVITMKILLCARQNYAKFIFISTVSFLLRGIDNSEKKSSFINTTI